MASRKPIVLVSGELQQLQSGDQIDNTVLDPELAALANLTSAADKVPYFTGSGTAALSTYNASARSIDGLSGTANTAPYFSGTDVAALFTLTSFGRSLVDDADAATGRLTLLVRDELRLTAVKTSNYTAAVGDLVVADISAGVFTVTLPTSPAVDDIVGVLLHNKATGTGALTITNSLSGTPLIVGKGGSFGASIKLHVSCDYVKLQYKGSSVWQIIVDALAPHACELQGLNQSMTNNASTQVNLGTQNFDNGAGIAVAGSNKITTQRAGRYMVTANIAWDAVLTAGTGVAQMKIDVGGTTKILDQMGMHFTTFYKSVSGTLDLAAGVDLTFSIFHNNGANRTTSNATPAKFSALEIR